MFVQMDRSRGSSVALSHKEQLELLVKPWNKAFSAESNLKAWAKGGFGWNGITQKPLWLQKVKDEGKNVEQRARSNKEKRANASIEHALSKEYDFDRALKAPNLWKRGVTELQSEQNESFRREEGDGDDDPTVVAERRTSKSLTAELQLLRVPVTSWPGRKVKNFHDWVAEIKAYKAEEVKERMNQLMPLVEYKRMDQGKAYLAKYLEIEHNNEEMFNHGRLIEHVFEAYPKLNDKIQIEWDAIFGPRSGKQAKVAAQKKAPAAKHEQFGFGAYQSQSDVRAFTSQASAQSTVKPSANACAVLSAATAFASQAASAAKGVAATAVVSAYKGVAAGSVVANDATTGITSSGAVGGGATALQALKTLKHNELKRLCHKRQLNVSGNKDELYERLLNSSAAHSPDTQVADGPSKQAKKMLGADRHVQWADGACQPLATLAAGGDPAESTDEPDGVSILAPRARRETQEPQRLACSDRHADNRMDVSSALRL